MGATISSLEVQNFHPKDRNVSPSGPMLNGKSTHMGSKDTFVQPPKLTYDPSSSSRLPRSASTRSGNMPMKGKPLIFAAMATVEQFEPPLPVQSSPSSRVEQRNRPASPATAYPSPPTEYDPVLPTNNSGPFNATIPHVVYPMVESSTDHELPLNQTLSRPTMTVPPRETRTPRIEGTSQLPQPPPGDLYPQPKTPPRTKKSSKSGGTPVRSPSDRSLMSDVNGHTRGPSDTVPHKMLTKARPTTPLSPGVPAKKLAAPVEVVDDEVARNAGLPLDDDPFARTEGVRLIKPTSRDGPPSRPRTREGPKPSQLGSDDSIVAPSRSDSGVKMNTDDNTTPPRPTIANGTPPTPISPEEYRYARAQRRGEGLERTPPPFMASLPVREDRPPGPFPLAVFVADPPLLSTLLVYLSFFDWCVLSSVTKEIRKSLVQSDQLREVVLERYLKTVGYARWAWNEPEPLSLSLLVSTLGALLHSILTRLRLVPGSP